MEVESEENDIEKKISKETRRPFIEVTNLIIQKLILATMYGKYIYKNLAIEKYVTFSAFCD